MIRRPPRSTLFPSRRSSDLHRRGAVEQPVVGLADVPAPREHVVEVVGLGRGEAAGRPVRLRALRLDRKSTRLNSSHTVISYAVFCLKKKNKDSTTDLLQ